MKKIIRVAVFVLILLLLLIPVTNILYTGIGNVGEIKACEKYFQRLPENSMDILFMGSSSMWAGVSPLIIYNEIGAAGFNRSATVTTTPTLYYYLEEALMTQHPKLLVLDAYALFIPYDEVFMRAAVDSMDYSEAKQHAIDHYSTGDYGNFFTRMSFYVPYLRYNSNWNEVNYASVLNYYKAVLSDYDPLCPMGGRLNRNVKTFEWEDKLQPTEERSVPKQDQYDYLLKIFDLCAENDIEVMVVTIPNSCSTYADYNKMNDICAEKGVKYFDLGLIMDELGVDPATDYSDEGIHMNLSGNMKVSVYLAQLIAENYSIPDRRGTPGYEFYDSYLAEFLARTPEYAQK